jgi:ABC-2 type transport system ATP-binding protein
MNAIELKNISKQFGKVKALDNMSLSVQQGEVIALLGPNGAGKTTAISVMLGLRSPDTGSAKIFGLEPRERAAQLRFGAMLQSSELPASLKCHEVLELFARQYSQPIGVQAALALAGLEEQASQLSSGLSGGQKKRLCFALSMIGNPDLLFLDEPTAALDVEARRIFWEQVSGLAKAGKTIVLTTHYLEEADALASRIVVVNQGRIVADGTPNQIKARVGGKKVQFKLVNPQSLVPIANTNRWSVIGDQISFFTLEPERILSQLFSSQYPISDLSVTGVGLEEAFVEITSQTSPV